MLQTFGKHQILCSPEASLLVKAKHFPAAYPQGRVRRRFRTTVEASYSSDSSSESSRSILEAFYYGRAFAETLNAKVGAVVEDVLSDIGKQSAESSQALREFQEEVEERAQSEFSEFLSASSNGASYPPNAALSNTTVYSSDGRFSAGNGRQPVVAASPDLQETVDELRAEMALTRAAVQSYRNKLQQYNPQ